MKKKYLRVMAFSSLLFAFGFFISGCSCAKEYKVTFVNDNNSDVIRYVKRGETLTDIPPVPVVKLKYCLWEDVDLSNIKHDIVVHSNCYSSVDTLTVKNVDSQIDVEVSSPEADLDYILRNIELEVTFESGETKKLYDGEYIIETNGYNKDRSGNYIVSIIYNNAKKDININVNKINNYLTVTSSRNGYYGEGFPELVANTDVPGELTFDENQTIEIGDKSYNYTFIPEDTNKYATIHDKIMINFIKAESLSINKTSLQVAYGTTKQQIINMLKDGLKVEAKYGTAYRVIENNYAIKSDNFQVSLPGDFKFNVVYENLSSSDIIVTVDKSDSYSFSVDNVNEFIMSNSSKLEDVAAFVKSKSLVKSAVAGDFSFNEGQTLKPGQYIYDYTFTPKDEYANVYAIKTGSIIVHAYKAESLEFSTTTMEVKYGTGKDSVIDSLKAGMETLIVYYNDSKKIAIDKSNISITIDDNYNANRPGTYTYTISYNNEISAEGSFELKKRELVLYQEWEEEIEPNVYSYVNNDGDFILKNSVVNDDNYKSFPEFTMKAKKDDFDVSKFTIVPDIDNIDENGNVIVGAISDDGESYIYHIIIVPDASISDTYSQIKLTYEISRIPSI